jgi:iron(III) transport system permease protein
MAVQVAAPPVAAPRGRTPRLHLPSPSPLVLIACIPSAAIIGLLGLTIWISFQVDVLNPVPTLEHYIQLYTDSFAWTAFLNTLEFAAVTLLFAVAIGVPMAWLVERTDLPGRGIIPTLVPVGLLIPGYISAMGWVLLLSPRIGVINTLLKSLTGASSAPIDITTIPGMGWVLGLGLASLVFVFTSVSLRGMDPALEESATMSGAGFRTWMRRITLPLAWPGVMAAGLFTLTIALSILDVPLVIGQSNRIYVFSTYILSQTNPQMTSGPQYGLPAAFSSLMIVIALGLAWAYSRVLKQSRRYQVVSGKNYRPRVVALGWWTVPAWAGLGLYFVLAQVLPLLMIVWASLIPFFQPPSPAALHLVSLSGFKGISLDDLSDGLKHTAIVMGAVPTCTLALSLVFSWIVLRTRSRFRLAFDYIAFLSSAVPPVIYGFGALVLTLFLITWPGNLYRSLGLLVAVMVVWTLSLGTRMTNSGLIQIHNELEEAGFTSGGSLGQVFQRVLLPLLRPTLTYAWLWIALLVYRDLTLPTMLFSRNSQTLSVVIWNLWTRGTTDQACAISLVMLALSIPLIAIFWRLRGGIEHI